MSRALKFVIGLAGVSGLAWIHHGPLGNGEAFIQRLEDQAKAAVVASEVPGIGVRLGRDPLSRQATLSGNADQFQREGQGELKGLNDLVGEIGGVSGVRWTDEPERRSVPLLLETWLQALVAYLIGLGIAWLLWGRPKREGFY